MPMNFQELKMTAVALAMIWRNTRGGEVDMLAACEDFAAVMGLKRQADFPDKGTPEYEAVREEWKYKLR